MPALAFLLGLFIPRSLAKRGTWRYLADRVTLILYLYLLWFIIQGVIEIAASGVKNNPRDPSDLLEVWRPLAHLWSLPFLAVATVVIVAAKPWGSWPRGLLAGPLLLAFSVLTWAWNPEIAGLRGLSLIGFVAAGAIVGLGRLAIWMSSRPMWWAVLGILSVTVLVLLQPGDLLTSTTAEASRPVAIRLLSIVASSAGILAVLGMAVILATIPRLADVLGMIGRWTLSIYLAHVIIVAGMRIVLTRLGFDSGPLIVVLAVAAGVAIPVAAGQFTSRRPWLSWIFDLPEPVKKLLATAVPLRPHAKLAS
jgi:fucose 4-O-acetylase-like acetyltransferase